MQQTIKTLALLFTLLIFSTRLLADVNVLVIGSTHSFSEGAESGVVHEKPFNPAAITTHLQSILAQDPAITETVNVEFEDIYKTKLQTVIYSAGNPNDFTSHCYSLAQHYMWPDGKAARLANLRGQGTRVWDYIVLCNDPYLMANFPGMVAEGVKLIKEEVAKSPNPAQVVLLAQWPETSSTFTATQFNEIAYRVGNSAGIAVVPAGKAWDSYGSKDTSANHPTPRGEYLAAASIYSKLFNRSAKTSAYDYPSVGDAIADHALSVVQANASVAQYSGTYTSFNPFQMKYLTKRVVSYRETGTSTEDRMAQALDRLDDVQRITFNTSGYAGVPGTRWDFNYGRGNDWWEPEKQYDVNSTIYDWVYGFPMHHYDTASAPTTMPYGIDKHYYYATTYEDGTDLGIAYNMIRPGTREPDWPEAVRAIPIRLMWQKMCQVSPGFNPLGDSTHMHPHLNDASAAFMYTLLSGRCPVVVEPTPQGSTNPAWMQWLGHKIGYETAWQMSHLSTRAPGFKVLPSSRTTTSITPTTKETMTVEFANPPQSDVTVNVSVSNANAVIVGANQLVFTPQNYNIPQSVSIAGIPGSAASEAFSVVYTTVSTDEIYHGLGDTWDYTITRSAPVTLTRVDKGTTQVSANQNLPVTINLNTAGASSSNTTLAGPSRGTTTWSGSNVIYTPASDFTGKDGFSFATNNAGTLSVGYIEITVSSAVPNGMVSYRGNGSNGGAVPIDSATYAQNATVTVLGNTGNLTRTAYNFNGWNTAANGSGTSYNAGATFTMGASGAILYAQWTSVPTYTVTYNGNSNSGGFIPSNQIKTDGVNLTLATNSGGLVRNGYTFAGWNTAANGTGTDYAAGGTYSGNANLTLFAKWTPNNYTVTFNANGGDPPSPTSKSVTYGTPYGTLATISRSGYTFNGWFTATTGGTLILSTTNVTITSNQTLYAQWTAITSYTVSYNGNGAESGTAPADQSKLLDVTLVLATNSGGLTRSGFTFAGWNTAANGSGTAYAAGANYTANAAVTLYAQWAGAATYTISYDGNGNTGGTAPSDQTKTQGVALTLATNSGDLTKTGYGFAGWNTAANGSGTAYASGASYVTDSAVTLHAQWNAIPVANAGTDQTVVLTGTAWSPAQLTPQLWLDADDASTITLNGATVSEWRDKSGNSRHAAQTTAASQPTRTAAALNGKPVLSFDGTADFLNLGTGLDFLAGVSHSAFVVTKPTTFNNIYGAANGSAGANSLHVGFNGTTYRMNYWGNDYLPARTANFVSGSANIVNYIWTSGTSKQILANGKSEGTNASAGVIGTMSGGGRIGNIVGQGYIGGDIAEMVFLTGTVSASDRESMEGYLAHKWGLAANLATAHPYKNSAPGGSGVVANLDGTATDADSLTTTWSVVSGPASVTFANPAAIDTGATFTVAGSYTLRLTANDGISSVTDDVVITVNSPGAGNTVNYYGNGSTGGTAPVDAGSPYTSGATVTILGNTGTLVRTGHTFNNWNTATDGSGTGYAPGNTFNINSSTTLYAQWTPNTYTVTFEGNGGSAPSPTSKSVTYNSTYGTLATTSRAGYTFNGWFTATSGGTQITSGTTVAITTAQTLYAQWTVNTYAVTYDGNSATSGTVPSNQTKTHDVSLTLQNNTGALARAGYTFTGWNTAANGSGTAYAAGATYMANAAVTLYAQWTANTYTVTFEANGGSAPSPTSKSVTYDATYGTLATTSRAGYTFNGWFTATSGGTLITTSTAVTNASDHTLYAQWTPDTYVVTYDGNGNTSGTVPSNQTKTHDINLTIATNSGSLARTGHTFTGWNTAANGSGAAYAINATYSANAAVTLYAQWSLGSFLTWDANATTANQTDGAGVWLNTNQWWTGTTNASWSSGSHATFGNGGTGGSVTIAGPTTLESLSFNPFTGTYTLGAAGQTLTINGGITMNANAGAATILSPITLGGPQTWTNQSANTLTISGALANGGNTLTVDGSGFINFTTPLAAGGGGITKNGAGRLQLNNAVQLYTGPTIVNGGVLSYGDNSAQLPAANITLNGGVIDQRWTAMFTRALGISDNQIQITGGASGFSNNNGSHTVRINNNVSTEVVWGASNEAGNANATGFFNPSTFVLQSAFTQNNTTLTFDNPIDFNGSTRTIHVNAGIGGASAAAFTGVVRSSTGTAGIIKTGGGILILNGANTFAGPITISGGNLRIGNNTAGSLTGGNYAGNISIASGANLQVWSTLAHTISGTISGGGGLHKAYGGALTLTGSNTYSGRTSFLPQSTAGFTVNITSFNSVNGGTPLLASSSLGAPTTIANGTIDVGSGTAQAGVNLTYSGPGETTDRVINFGFNGTASQTLSASGSGPLKFTSAMTGNTLTTQSGALILRGTGSGEITQALPALPTGGLSKNDSGTWILGGANSYTGPTAITAGKLFINGDQSTATGNVTVSANATLGGTGTLGGNTTIAASGKLEFNLDTPSASHDPLNLSPGKDFIFSGASTLTITSSAGAAPGIYTLVTGGNNITGVAPATVNLPVGWIASISVSGNSLVLNVASTGVDTTAPTLVSITDDRGGASVIANSTVNYSVTFSEDMDAATVQPADFGNAGTASGVINSATETSPGVFQVSVTPSSAGSLQLQINAGAALADLAGLTVNTTSAIPDDTTITVTPLNSAPVAISQNVTTNEDTALPITLAGTDVDGNPLTYTVLSVPSNGALSGTAPNLTYTPAANYNGSDSFTFRVNDGTLNSNTATVAIAVNAVNDVPVATAQSVTTPEDTALSITLSGTDIEYGTLTYTIVTPPLNGNLSGTAPNLTYTPAANTNGPDAFTFTVNDGLLDSAPVNVVITVNPVNDTPTATAQSVTTAEDTALPITLTGTDIENSTLTHTIVTPPANGTLSGTAPNLTYTPSANFNGSDSFTFRVNDGTLNSNTATVSITVNAVNDVPVAVVQNVTTDEDIPLSVTLTGTDIENSTLTYTVVASPANGTLSGTAPNITYTPSANFNGSDSFTFTVNDGTIDSATATVSITVNAVNDVPVATAQSVTTAEDTALPITLAGTDVENSALTHTIVTPPANGTLSGTAPNLTYTPAANTNGPDSFTFTVNDGLLDSAPVNVVITVTQINDAPVASAQSVTTPEDTALSITLTGTDIENSTLTFTVVTPPANGTLSGTAPNLTYTPAANYNGADSFTFKVNDGTVDSATATISITVTAVNDLPVFTTNPIVAAGATESVAYTGQTLAGSAADTDAGDSISYSKVSGPAWLAVASNGTLSGTPPSGSAGLNSFVVRATDSASGTADATLQITVTGLPLPWVSTDIGTGMLAGSTTFSSGTFTQAGSGIIGSTTDKLRYTYQTLTGDGEIIARISSLQNTGTASRVGVMIRDTLAANSKQIFMGMTGSNAYRWVRRTTTGGSTSSTNSSSGTIPNTWIRLVRSGTTITAYKSTNGTSWTTVGSTTGTTFAATCYIGLAVGSGSDSTLNTSRFSNVSVTP